MKLNYIKIIIMFCFLVILFYICLMINSLINYNFDLFKDIFVNILVILGFLFNIILWSRLYKIRKGNIIKENEIKSFYFSNFNGYIIKDLKKEIGFIDFRLYKNE